jgi:hypothetical protein
MFRTGEYLIRRAVIVTLKSAHARTREGGPEKRIFTCAFTDSSPTRIARDIDHRRKRPTQSDVVRFLRRNGSRAFGQRRIETARFTEWNREDRAITVNHVEAKQNGNLQTRLIHRHSLHLVRALGATNVEVRTEQTFANQIEMFRTKVSITFAIELLKLSEFFFERHLREQRVDSLLDVRRSL